MWRGALARVLKKHIYHTPQLFSRIFGAPVLAVKRDEKMCRRPYVRLV